MDIQFQTPFCCKCCTGAEAIQQYAPMIEGVYKCSRCGYVFDIPTGKFIYKKGFHDEFDFKSRITELEKEVFDLKQRLGINESNFSCLSG